MAEIWRPSSLARLATGTGGSDDPGMNQRIPSTERLLDLSHVIRTGMAVAPGLPAPRIEPYLSHAASRSRYAGLAEFEITRLSLVGNTGTSLDSPFHRYAGGTDIASLSLDRLAGVPGVCLDLGPRAADHAAVDLDARDLNGVAVLIRTGWDRHWGVADYWASGPFLDRRLVEALIEQQPALVGVDFANVDDPADLARPIHSTLLANGIPIIEHLRGLERLPARGFRLFALPLCIEGAGALPVRVVAELEPPSDNADAGRRARDPPLRRG